MVGALNQACQSNAVYNVTSKTLLLQIAATPNRTPESLLIVVALWTREPEIARRIAESRCHKATKVQILPGPKP